MTSTAHLVLTPLYPPERFGGIEKIVNHLAEGVAALGDSVVVVAGAGHGPRRSESSGVVVSWAGNGNDPGDPLDRRYQQALVAAGVAAVADAGADSVVIHAHDWFVGPAAGELSSILGAPVVAVFHGDKHTEYRGRLDERRRQIHARQVDLARGAARVLCYSAYLRGCIARSTGRQESDIDLFRCGLDRVAPDFTVRRTGTVLYLGRLAPEKGIDTLLRAFRHVIDAELPAQLRVVGSGPAEADLRGVAESLQLTQMSFHPFTADAAVVDSELRAASMLVLPSNFEPFGLVLLEAISRGVPVVASNCGGPPEIITDHVTGRLFAAGDDRRLAEAIGDVLTDEASARARAAVAVARLAEDFAWERAAGHLRKVALSAAGTVRVQVA